MGTEEVLAANGCMDEQSLNGLGESKLVTGKSVIISAQADFKLLWFSS